MNPRFTIDLLRPGRVAQTWQEAFTGPSGRRRLVLFGLAGAAVLLLILVAGILPTYWRLSDDLNALPNLRRDLTATENDLSVLRTNLQALTLEARRQVRWAELLNAFSQQTPATLKLVRLEAVRTRPPPAPRPQPGQPPAEVRPEGVLRIDAVTPLVAGAPPLLEIAEFMAGLMRDPAVNKRFTLRSWEIKPPAGATPDGQQLLNVSIMLGEKSL
ncbi:MAG: hypothetical protein ABW020_12565 [Candidatus Rokuibacteriota bacterium]